MKCLIEGCLFPAIGNSKYCEKHKEIACSKWMEMINQQKEQKEQLSEIFAKAYEHALKAAQQAGEEHNPAPMVVCEHDDVLDDNSPIKKHWHVPQGVCGFAWVYIRPGNCKLANWLKKTYPNDWKTDSYSGGCKYWVFQYNQSYEKKMKFAGILAKELFFKIKELSEENNMPNPLTKVIIGHNGRLD